MGRETEPSRFDELADAEFMTGEAVALDVRPSGFVLNAAGAVIDALISVLLVVGILVLLGKAGVLADPAFGPALTVTSLAVCLVIVPLVLEQATGGRSVGRIAVGSRIVRDDGGAVRFRHSFIRALLGVIEIFGTAGGLAALVGLVHPRSKRVGDVLAGTCSRLERVPKVRPTEYSVPAELDDWARTADVGRLPDRLAGRIARFLAQAQALRPAARISLSEELAREATRYVFPIPAVAAESFLIAITALRRDRDRVALALERERLDRLDPVLHRLPHGFPDRADGAD